MVPKSTLTILFEPPFWVGLYERVDGGKYEVCKITFGAEPKDYKEESKASGKIRARRDKFPIEKHFAIF